ncbi:MAG: FAD-dependent monooxygenase [Hyphomicrobiales bacterium]|nr:FAD-dependent monooxygenase [Hyphomicrobiales bacterium]
MSASAPILIAGGGVGGLSAAIALSRRGFSVRVLERAPAFSESGAGVQLGPNATRILRDWGVAGAVEDRAFRPGRIELFDAASGVRLNCVPLGARVAQRYGAPYLTLLRAGLHEALLLAATQRGVEITTGFTVEAVSQTAAGVSAISTEGERASGAALIGADGLRSAVRRAIAPDARLKETGAVAWRANTPVAGDPGDVGVWLHAARHLVRYPVDRGRSWNFVAVTREAAAPDFADWPAVIRDAAPPPAEWRPWPLFEAPPLPVWSDRRMTLLGDAAHPLPPFLASGAVMAIEDAETLAMEAASSANDLPGAFQRYEQRRKARVGLVARRSRRMGEIYHMSGVMRLARNAVIAATPSMRLLARNDWLYGFRV